MAAARLQRWALILSAYQYEIEFRSTKSPANADGLSRLPLSSHIPHPLSNEPSIFNMKAYLSLLAGSDKPVVQIQSSVKS